LIGPGRARAALAVWAAALLPTAGGATLPRGAGDAVWRTYELDVAAAGAPSLAPVGDDALAEALRAARFDAIVLWLPPGDPRAPDAPPEPRALLQSGDSASAALAELVAPFRARQLDVAVGLRARADPAELAFIPRDRRILIERSGGAPLDVERVFRPAVRRFTWFRPDPFGRDPPPARLALSSRLLIPTDPLLKARQTELDLAAFSGLAHDVSRSVERQSAVASDLADAIAGRDPQAFDPFLNEWIGERPQGPLAPLRRGPPLLDLEELLFSIGRDGTSGLAAQLQAGGFRGRWSLPGLAGGDDPALQVARPGELAADQLLAWAAMLDRRLGALTRFAEAMAGGSRDLRPELLALLDPGDPAIGTLPPPMRDAWIATLALDRALVEQLEPWRIRFTTWSLASAGLATGSQVVKVVRADDPRLGPWGQAVEELLGARSIDLWSVAQLRPGLEVVLRGELALRDPRNVRLRVDAAARRSVRVNGATAVAPLDPGRGPLLATLPLPAGTSTIEVLLELDGTRASIDVDLDLLPHRVEGIVLEPDRASRVHEPAVRLRDPGALGGASLLRPAGRPAPDSGPGSGQASLPFVLSRASRFDVWVHALAPPDRAGSITIRFDDGADRELAIGSSARWTWIRAAAPATLAAGDHALHLGFPVENVRVDQVVLLPTELVLPRRPADDAPLAATAWRFDPLGAGIVVDLPPLEATALLGRAFTVEKGGSYGAFVWLKGSDPLAPGQWAELELTAPSGRHRFLLPAGTPYEEWVALGSVALAAGERIQLQAQGHGALARIAFVR